MAPKTQPRPAGAKDVPPDVDVNALVDEKLEAFAGVQAKAMEDMEGRMTGALENLAHEVVQALSAVGQAQAQAVSGEPVEPLDPSELHPGLPEGTVRFWSPFKEYRIFVDRGSTIVIDNKPVVYPTKYVEFTNGIADVSDEASIEYLRNHPDLGTDFFEDPTAMPMAQVGITEGPRSTGTARRTRPEAELAAKL